MFHRLPTVCNVFCVTAKCILINSINRLNLIDFLIRAKWVLCWVETKCLYVILANVSLQDVRVVNIFYSFRCASLYLLYVVFQTCTQDNLTQHQFQWKFGIVTLGATFISKMSKRCFLLVCSLCWQSSHQPLKTEAQILSETFNRYYTMTRLFGSKFDTVTLKTLILFI